MMKKYLILTLMVMPGMLWASDGIRGRVVDSRGEPVDAVAVILQTIDDEYIDAVITEPDGTFMFLTEPGAYKIYFQHLLYEPLMMVLDGNDPEIITLKEKDMLLQEVTVTAERPQVKVEGGALIYDTQQLIKGKPVTNAFEAIKELPGVLVSDESLSLMGASELHIVIDGRLTNLSLDQLISMLKSMPSSRVKRTEVMYNAPARYNVKGALINVVLEKGDAAETIQGEAGVEYQQHHYPDGRVHGSLLYNKDRFNMDVTATGQKRKGWSGEDMFARHTLKDETVEIDQINRGRSDRWAGTFRLGMDYSFKNEDKLSASYYMEGSDYDVTRTSSSRYEYLATDISREMESRTEVDGHSLLQNVQIQYQSHRKWTAGFDFTRYYTPDEQYYLNREKNEVRTDMLNTNKQAINKWMLFFNKDHAFENGWSMNYGINASLARSKNDVAYLYADNNDYVLDRESLLDDLQKEYGGNGFVEVARKFGKLSASASLKLEYFRSDYESNGEKSVLWNDWTLFPNASFSYTFSPSNILQLTISGDKRYPSYWSVNPQTMYLNAYSVTMGNPALKPSRSYQGQLAYIFKQKYMFIAFTNYQPDKFAQLPYQSPDELVNVFRFENFDYSLTSGIGAIVPFRVGTVLNSRVTLYGMRLQEKSDKFYDTPFNNVRYFGQAVMSNTINISDKQPNLKLSIDGYFVSPAQQGLYKLGNYYDVSAGLKWLFADERATITLKYNNIFKSNMPRTITIDNGNQYSRMKNIDDSSYVGVAFAWKFGGYKEKQHKKVDASRFGK